MDRLLAQPSLRVARSGDGPQRILVDLCVADLRRYEMVVGRVVHRIERSLDPDVLANRAGPTQLLPWRPARRRWDRLIRDLIDPRQHGALLLTDVRRCYASIGPAAVEAGLRRVGAGAGARAGVEGFLRLTMGAGIEGLPVGPQPSAVLANAVLAIADDAARHEGARIARWVDDVAIAGAPATVHRAYRAWLGSIHELGLRENEAKRRILRLGSAPFGRDVASISPSARGMMRPP